MSVNLFDIPDVDYSYKAKRWVPFKPANSGTQPILFTVPASDDYYDLNDTKLEIKIRLNTSGTNGVSSTEGSVSDANNSKYIYCVNNFGHSIFSQMNLSFNGVLMTEQSNAYHQKAYLETLQNYNRQEGETLLAPQGWVNELHVKDKLVPTNATNDDEPNPNCLGRQNRSESPHQSLTGESVSYLFHQTAHCRVKNRQMSGPQRADRFGIVFE